MVNQLVSHQTNISSVDWTPPLKGHAAGRKHLITDNKNSEQNLEARESWRSWQSGDVVLDPVGENLMFVKLMKD